MLELHQNHPGISCMKDVACSYFWWPNKLNQHLEDGQSLHIMLSCQGGSFSCPSLHPWIQPIKPWERINVDLIMMDAYLRGRSYSDDIHMQV